MDKRKIGILYGGRSTEHEISIRSAKKVGSFIDKEQYEVIFIGITKQGKWYLTTEINENINSGQPLHLLLDTKSGGLFIQNGDRVSVDLFFPVLHGTDGEDGNIQGLLTAMNLQFAGTGVLGSSLCMSKLISKQLLQAADLPVVPFRMYKKSHSGEIKFDELAEFLGLPFMVKAANLGSSVGINKVKTKEELINAIDEAFRYDDTLLVEKYIKGRELECSVLGNDNPEASLAAEIVINPDYEFYTYKAKYLDPDAVRLDVPSSIEDDLHKKVQELSIEAFKALQCNDFARVDLFLHESDNIYINEINTIPGFTDASMFPMMWKERGIDFTSLISKIINLAFERYKNVSKQRDYKVVN